MYLRVDVFSFHYETLFLTIIYIKTIFLAKMRESFFKENEYYKGSIHFFHLFESQNKLTTVYKI